MSDIADACVDERHYNFLVSLRRLADGWEAHDAEIESLKAEIQTLRRQLVQKSLTSTAVSVKER